MTGSIDGLPAGSPLAEFLLNGRCAVVTGAARGIGRAIAEGLCGAGAAVALVDRDFDAASAAAEVLLRGGGEARAFRADIAREEDVLAVCEAILAWSGRFDVLVNNAGIAIRRPATEMPLADWDRVVAVNMTGVFLMARTVARSMDGQGGGAIVNIASVMGLSGGLYPNVAYQTTKGAVVNMTRALAVEWASVGIRVNAIAPGWVRTDLTTKLFDDPDTVARITAATPLARIAEPADLVGAVIFLASPAASMVTGQTLAVDGGFLAV